MAEIKSFALYAGKVSCQIDDLRAREEAYQEIYIHLIESKENLLKTGISEKEAENAALFQMGDAADLGGELDHIHTPKLKLLHILIISLILILIAVSIYGYFYWQLGILERGI